MERPGKFQRLAAHPQIDAACIASTQEGKVHVEATRGADHWGRVFPFVISMMKMAKVASARAVLEKHTIVVESDGDKVIAVAFSTGTDVSKSVRRMIRQAFGKRRKIPPEQSIGGLTRDDLDAMPGIPRADPGTQVFGDKITHGDGKR